MAGEADPDPRPLTGTRSPASRLFARHLIAFCLVNVVLTAINVYGGAPWWAFWPFAGWAVVLMLHFLFYRAGTVDEAWVEERTEELRARSYDLGHIDSIRNRPAPSVGAPQRPTTPEEKGDSHG